MKSLARRLSAALGALVAAGLLLASCGGVGEDGSGAAPPDTLTTGVVNGFGSVIVGGVRFDVSGADIVVDGAAGRSQADLRVGMVVEVTGTLAADGASGGATRVVYESLLRGTIDDLPAARTVRVLGQSVVIDDTTVFAGAAGADDLRAGDRLQVSGFRSPDGSLKATFVSRESGTGDLQLTAFVTSVAGNIVRLAGLDVSIANATLVGVTAPSLAPGQLVRAVLQAPPVAGAAVATRLTLIDTRLSDALRKLQVQGIVAQWDAAAGQFKLNGLTVQVNANTQYQDGTVADLANGARVEVSGAFSSSQLLTADKVRIVSGMLSGYGRGRVTAVNVAEKRFNLLDIPGIDIRLRAGTLLNDNSLAGGVLRLDNLAVGDEVFVLGRANGARIDAELVTRLPRITPGSGVAGPVTNVNGATLTILGTTVAANGANFFDAQGQPETQSAFLVALRLTDEVRAEGSYSAGVLAALNVRRVR
jgi:Domain of unknown function (DUF5666)